MGGGERGLLSVLLNANMVNIIVWLLNSFILHCYHAPGSPWLVIEFDHNGCLLRYLQDHRQETGDQNVDGSKTPLSYAEKLKLAFGIVKGMCHLAKKKASVFLSFI